MTIKEAMKSRHTVRKYKNEKLSAGITKALSGRISDNNDKYGLQMRLVTENDDAFGVILKLFLAKNVRNYIVLAGKDSKDLYEKLGYCGIDAALYAQTLGLNTWWIAGTYSKKKVAKLSNLTEGEKLAGIIAVGYGENGGVPHKSKKAGDISEYAGEAPDWFKSGVEAVLLAPTALNRQAFKIKGSGREVSITCSNGAFSGIDSGIAKYHFELGAGKENFDWV